MSNELSYEQTVVKLLTEIRDALYVPYTYTTTGKNITDEINDLYQKQIAAATKAHETKKNELNHKEKEFDGNIKNTLVTLHEGEYIINKKYKDVEDSINRQSLYYELKQPIIDAIKKSGLEVTDKAIESIIKQIIEVNKDEK